jgi:hypothetical protein
LETNLQEFVQEGTGEALGEGGKNGNAGIGRNIPEIELALGGRIRLPDGRSRLDCARKILKGLIRLDWV